MASLLNLNGWLVGLNASHLEQQQKASLPAGGEGMGILKETLQKLPGNLKNEKILK